MEPKMLRLTKTLALSECQLKFVGADGAATFSGYASTFDGVDSYGDTIQKGAYADVIARIKKGAARMPKMFVNHNSWELPVGKWTSISEDSRGLAMEGEFTPGNQRAAEVRAAMQHGTVDGLSIGFIVGEYKMLDEGKRRLIEKVAELPETSIVTFPADDAARVDLASVKSALDDIESIKDLEDFLREAGGFSKSLALATASRCKRIFTRSESGVIQLPSDLASLIARNALEAKSL
jgi:HK97 family phage prohead protease